jgi:hypothetical protein
VSTRPLFIAGVQRSGTTLLRAMLLAHPDVYIPYESRFLFRVLDVVDRGGSPSEARRVLLRGVRNGWSDAGETVADELMRLDPEQVDIADLVRTAFATAAASAGRRWWGDKTPDMVLHLDRIGTLLPEVGLVHMVRDGRNVVAALQNAPWLTLTTTEAAQHWKDRVRVGEAAGRRLGARYHLLRYEDLVTDPEATLRTLCSFARLDFHPAMLDHRATSPAVIASTRFPDAHSRLLQPLDPEARSWRDELSAAQVEEVHRVIGDTLAELGYDVEGAR